MAEFPDPSQFVPGEWFCAKCDFRQTQSFLSASDGSITPNKARPNPCPNCACSLWPVSWEMNAKDAWHYLSIEMARTRQLEQQLWDEGVEPLAAPSERGDG